MTQEHKKYLRKLKLKKLMIHSTQILILVGFFLMWELLSSKKIIDPFFFSSPSRTIAIIKDLYIDGVLFKHISATLLETMYGFLISTVVGTLIAILMWSSTTLCKVLDPYLITLNALPKVALGPMIIIWVGSGTKAIVTMAILICIIITILSMLTGFLSVDKEKVMLLKSLNASKFTILYKLILPSNIPTFLSVLKINVGLAWVGTIMGEYLVSREGLGYLIVYGSQMLQLDLVIASTLILCVLASLMYIFVAILEKFTKKFF